MTEFQIVTTMFVAPFIALTIAYGIGLAVLEYSERKAIRAIKQELRK